MKILLSPLSAIITTLLLTWLTIANPVLLQNVDLKFTDQLIVGEKQFIDDVVLVDISEETLNVHGQFPLPRDVYGDLIERLRKANAGVIVFNLSFPEADRTEKDQIFKSLLGQGVVISHFPTEKSQERAAYTTGIVEVGPRAFPFVPHYSGIAANLPEYESVASGIGIANTIPEIDGVVRRLPMISAVGEMLYPSIILEIFKVYKGTNTYQIKSDAFGVTAVRVKGFPAITTDSKSRIWINPNFEFKRYDLIDEFPDLNGATVFVGVTAEGISNPVPTATGAVYGHDIVAKSFTSVANGYNITTPQLSEIAKIAAILVLGLLIIATSYVRFGWLFPIILISGTIYAPFYMFANYAQLYMVAVQGLMGIVVFAHVYGFKYGQEYFAKMQIKKQFGGYASPEVVEILQKNPSLIKDGQKKEVSIVFSDLRGFTPLGESFGDDVKGLTLVMNSYMDAITQPVLDARGMIIKYIGDASMHIHNAPIDDPEHPKTAVQTGLNMLKAVDKFNEKITSEGRPPIGMGAGINTGLGYIGEMGSTARHSYDVLGDSVSTAARIESKCKEYGCLLLVGGATVERCEDDFFFLKIDDLAVKGKSVGISIYTVLDDVTDEYLREKSNHVAMHDMYRSQDFNSTITMCVELKDKFDGKMNKYYDMWIERCEFQLTQDLPKDWNGIHIATSK